MYKATINTTTYAVETTNGTTGTLNNTPFNLDTITVANGILSIIKDNISYNVEIVKTNTESKIVTVKVNNTTYTVSVKDQYDELLKQLGMENLGTKKINELKAPMPGLVLNIVVTEGQTVKKGDALIVLEAMKMENSLKSPTDGVIKKIAITKGDAVEKNQLLLSFE
jgi:biotin carboxyl carrier protein